MVEVTGLFIYPIKGARPVAANSIEIEDGGIRGDRVFAVFRNGERCNVKQIPGIMFIGAEWQASSLVLSYPNRDDFVLDTTSPGTDAVEQFRGGETPIGDMGDDVAEWLFQALGESVRLARISEPTPFVIPLPEFNDVHGKPQQRFIDAAPIMLASTDSLDDLNGRLESPVEMMRFRPNIVVSGLPAYAEDDQQDFQFNHVLLNQVAPCERCKVVTMDLETAETSKEPLATLARYRRRDNDYAGGVMFGSYLSVVSPGQLALGEVLRTG